MDQEYDAIIVGARIGGSVTAALLGDAGYRVLLIDRMAFPSDTISTHFFRGEYALTVFNQLDVLEELLSSGAPRLLRQYTYPNGGSEYEIQPPQSPGDIGYCLSVRRITLDQTLVRRACRAENVHLAEKTSVRDLLWDDQCAAGVRLQTNQGEREVRAKIVIGADGRNSTVAHLVQPAIEDTVPGFRAMYYQYFEGFDSLINESPDGPLFSFIGSEIAYAFPSDHNLACIAISVDLETCGGFKGQHEAKYHEHLLNHKGITERMGAAKPIGGVYSHGAAVNYLRTPQGSGWALVGDAGQYQDPWSGVGIDSASMAATFLADAIIGWFSGKSSEDEALSGFHQRRNDVCGAFFKMTVEEGREIASS